MDNGHFSLILLPTLSCDADCDYCFENKSAHNLDLVQLADILGKVTDYMDENAIEGLSIYWQGGEVLTLSPDWFRRAHELIQKTFAARKKQAVNYLQSNLISYGKGWNEVIAEMFGNTVGTSMDFPNLYRKLKGGGPGEYQRVWERKVREAREAGIEIGVIAIPNQRTLELGAERLYSYFVDELGIRSFQVNTPFPGGFQSTAKMGFPLDNEGLSRFAAELADIWMERGFEGGVRMGPFDKLLDHFLHGQRDFHCIWQSNCANDFFCIDPSGHVAQCDCWVASYPQFRFGNVLEADSLSELLLGSPVRQRLQSRPGRLMQKEDCLDCKYLSLCHGGCPVRAYTVWGDILRKDPYCGFYQRLFHTMETLAARHLRRLTERRQCVRKI